MPLTCAAHRMAYLGALLSACGGQLSGDYADGSANASGGRLGGGGVSGAAGSGAGGRAADTRGGAYGSGGIVVGGLGPIARGGAYASGGTSFGGRGPIARGGVPATGGTFSGGTGPIARGGVPATGGTFSGGTGPIARGGSVASGGITALGGSGTGGTPAAECIFSIPASLPELSASSFFDHPWPSDFRVDARGLSEFAGFPNPRPSTLLATYVAAVDDSLVGFSPAAPGYFRFTAPIDQATLPPDPLASLAPSSSVQLIDVDPSSSTRGQRIRVSLAWRATGDGYWADNTLAFMPTLGFPLREGTRYALVVTSALGAAGGRLGVCRGLRQVLGLEGATGAAAALRDAWADAVGRLESAGIPRTSIVHLTVFTTNRPTLATRSLRDWVASNYPVPEVMLLARAERTAGVMDAYEGAYGPSPDFQAGTPPFLLAGGGIMADSAGAPVLQRELELRFVLAVPSSGVCPMPASGYPVVLYGHGTGGDYRTVIEDGTAGLLAARCLASISIDQIFHGTRPGGPCAARGFVAPCNPLPESLAIFNSQNPASLRNTNRQAAIDLAELARLVAAGRLAVPSSTSYTGQPILFDAARVLLRAHSQGATSGALTLGVDKYLRGGVLSGAAAMASLSLLDRTQPENLATFMVSELYGSGSTATLDVFHPAMSLLQTMLDEADPLHYAASIVTQPRAGFAPKSVLMVEGIGADGQSDSYVSSHAIEVHALAMGLPPLFPLVWALPEYTWSQLLPVVVPPEGLSGNLALGQASGVLVQWAPPAGGEPHFVVFDVPAASAQAARFLQSMAVDPVPRIPPL